MGVFGIGVDIVEIDRIRRALDRHGERFLEKLLTPAERAYCEARRDPAPAVAARFAAKEAVAKALGTGIGAQLEWLDIEVRRAENGRPSILLTGAGARFAAEHGITELMVSLSHARQHAIAQALACTA